MNALLLFTACRNIERRANISRDKHKRSESIRRLAVRIYDTYEEACAVEAPEFLHDEGFRAEDDLFAMVYKQMEADLPKDDRNIAAYAAVMIWIEEAGGFYERVNACIAADPDDRDVRVFVGLLKDGLDECDFRDGSYMFSDPIVRGPKRLYSGRRRIAESDVLALEGALRSGNVIEIASVLSTSYRLEGRLEAKILLRIDIDPGCWDTQTGAPLGKMICGHASQNPGEHEVIVFPGSMFTVVDKIVNYDRQAEYILKPIRDLGSRPVVPVHMGVELAQCHRCGGFRLGK